MFEKNFFVFFFLVFINTAIKKIQCYFIRLRLTYVNLLTKKKRLDVKHISHLQLNILLNILKVVIKLLDENYTGDINKSGKI